MPKLVLLDGHSLAYRAFFALPSDLATSQGQVTNAVYGFTSMLIKLLGDEQPDAVILTWDVKGGTFRSEQYPEYKAQRDAPPDIFRTQLPLDWMQCISTSASCANTSGTSSSLIQLNCKFCRVVKCPNPLS